MSRAALAFPASLALLPWACTPLPSPLPPGAFTEQWPVWYDATRNREIAGRLFLPTAATNLEPAPLVLFSHGVGESILSYAYLGRAWAKAGYAVLFVEHPGSDVNAVDWDAVTPSLIAAARDPDNQLARPRDLSFALDQLAADAEFDGRVDQTLIVVAGHSLGAHAALALSGACFDVADSPANCFLDSRVIACMALSPPGAGQLGLTDDSWSEVTVPLLSIYGDIDTDVIYKDAAARRGAFDGALLSERYLAILTGVKHETFTGRDPAFPLASNAPQQQTLIATLTTAWLDAYLRDDAAARERLRSGELARLCVAACRVEYAPGDPAP